MASILLIDDDESILRSISIVLKSDGHSVTPIQDSRQGLDLVRKGGYDLIITDIRMSPVDGMEILRAALGSRPAIPTVVISAYSSDAAVEQGLKLGCAAYIKKPFKIQDVYDAVAKALSTTPKA